MHALCEVPAAKVHALTAPKFMKWYNRASSSVRNPKATLSASSVEPKAPPMNQFPTDRGKDGRVGVDSNRNSDRNGVVSGRGSRASENPRSDRRCRLQAAGRRVFWVSTPLTRSMATTLDDLRPRQARRQTLGSHTPYCLDCLSESVGWSVETQICGASRATYAEHRSLQCKNLQCSSER
jgi:hypothetical protein